MKSILVINGPNLNQLGIREKTIYGEKTLEEINSEMKKAAKEINLDVEFFQSNHEGAIVDRIQHSNTFSGIIMNPGAYAHTSIAILDAIRSIRIPVIEAHMSNIFNRETFRSNIITGKGVSGFIAGLGDKSYIAAIYAMKLLLAEEK